MTYNDIFRKRPILGNRILTPIRDKPEKPTKLMSNWEAEQRCQYYKAKEAFEQSYFDPPTGCKSLEMSPNGITKYWMWKCGCEEKMTIDVAIKEIKKFSFNWR